MIDRYAFHSLSYGVYLITSVDKNGKKVGCVANTFMQLTSEPLQVSVTLNKQNATTQAIRESGRFSATVLDETASMKLIGTFGFRSSHDYDKFEEHEHVLDEAQVPYVVQHSIARFSMKVVEEVDVKSHVVFIGEVEEAEQLNEGKPMTYAYYHQVKGGKTPPKASAFNPEAAVNAEVQQEINDLETIIAEEVAEAIEEGMGEEGKNYAWECLICGYVANVDELPDDFVCPVCGATKKDFIKIEV